MRITKKDWFCLFLGAVWIVGWITWAVVTEPEYPTKPARHAAR